jgi:hypothetical protein
MMNLLQRLQNWKTKLPTKTVKYIVIGAYCAVGCVCGFLLYHVVTVIQRSHSVNESYEEVRDRLLPVLVDYYVHGVTTDARTVLVALVETNPVDGSPVLIDIESRDADTDYRSASLTKLATLVAFQKTIGISDSQKITVTEPESRIEGASYASGESVTSHDLARALLVASSNQSAETLGRLAQRQSVDIQSVASRLYPGIRVDSLSGLDTTSTMSARDAVAIAWDYYRLDTLTAHESTKSSVSMGSGGVVSNTNPLVATYPEIIFSKTGFTSVAGGNLVVLVRVCDSLYGVAVMKDSFSGRFESVERYVRALRNACSVTEHVARETTESRVY